MTVDTVLIYSLNNIVQTSWVILANLSAGNYQWFTCKDEVFRFHKVIPNLFSKIRMCNHKTLVDYK
ncbi:Uncharacterised protein [Mycobacterium tuberculosis]|nr:Uncharacterised protein [Mycobacterium tuberculosis]